MRHGQGCLALPPSFLQVVIGVEPGRIGAAEIAVVLRTSRVLTDLKLSNMNIGPEGVKALAAALRVNEVLTTLNLR